MTSSEQQQSYNFHHPTVEITMNGQKSQSKLTRTQSSLLTVRSSIQNLSSVTDVDLINSHYSHSYSQLKDKDDEDDDDDDEEALKKNKPPPPRRIGSTGSTRFSPVLALSSLSAFTLLSFLFFYMNREEIPTSENLLVALIFIAITLFFASKNKTFINHTLTLTRQKLSQVNTKLLLLSPKPSTKIKWVIGETNLSTEKTPQLGVSWVTREGVEFYSNGDFYEGEFHKGKCNGSGVYNYFVNGRYEGDWIDGRYDGYGIESWLRGSKYRGQYRQGLRHGYGVYRFYTGDSYAGEWCNGQSHGVGAQTCSDGSCYVGEFKWALKHGLGCYYFRNGDRYTGEYFGDKIHGFGVYHFANGHCYEGSWHEGRKQGYGMYTFRNSDTKCGEWDAGNLKTPVPRLTDAVLRAVQAARKNAENAINVRQVDQQVNKAALAATRAATAARVATVKAVQNRMSGKFCHTNV